MSNTAFNPAELMPVTATNASLLFTALGIDPSLYAGKSSLDIASGCSNLTSELGNHGVQSFGVDVGYVDVESMKDRLEEYRSRQPRFEQMLDGDALSQFERDIDCRPHSYIPGDARHLPFADESFDLVTCSSFITSRVGLDEDFTGEVIEEAFRVLSTGGEFRVGPARDVSGYGQKNMDSFAIIENIRSGLSNIVEKNKSAEIVENADRGLRRFKITKL